MKNPKQVGAFGTHLRRLREEKNWSQQQLADSANIPKTTVQRIELAKSATSIDIMVSIAMALEVELKTLVDFDINGEISDRR